MQGSKGDGRPEFNCACGHMWTCGLDGGHFAKAKWLNPFDRVSIALDAIRNGKQTSHIEETYHGYGHTSVKMVKRSCCPEKYEDCDVSGNN